MIPPAETLRSFFGTGTEQAVAQFQRAHGLPPTGVVDAQTAAAIEREVGRLGQTPPRPAPLVVRGRVQADGRPFVGATVRAFDRDLRGEQALGQATSDTEGRYQISYTPEQFSRAEKGSADLFVRVLDRAGAVLASSPVLFNAPPEATVDLRIDGNAAGLLSEYERLLNELSPLLANVIIAGAAAPTLTDKLADLKGEELDFLTGETGFERQKLAFLSQAAVLHKKAAAQHLNLPAEVFYGLAREGLPSDLAALALVSRQKQSDALERALTDNLIPQALRATLPDVLGRLQQLAVREALHTPPAPGAATAGQLLGRVLTSPAQQAAFLTAYANHGDQPVEDFWRNLRSQPQFAGRVDGLQLTLQLGALTQNHLPLIQELQNTFKVKSPRDLVSLDAAAWTKLVNKETVGLPPDVPGDTPEEKTTNYVNGILSLLHAAFPTETVAHIVATAPDVNLDEPTRKAVSQFFRDAPDFDLRSTRVDTYVSDHAATVFKGIADADRSKVTDQVKRIQRLFQVSTSAETLTALLHTDLNSAHAIAQIPRSSFLARYQSKLGGEGQALALYRRAASVHARALHVYALLSDALNGVRPLALGGNGNGLGNGGGTKSGHVLFKKATPNDQFKGGGPQKINGQGQSVSEVVANYLPNYAELFNDSLSLCDCRHCRSVLSPAAYLVDLFEFLRNSAPNDQGRTPLDLLLARRPDLEQIPLTCENTETTLPYVDLVNEVLESYVALGHADASAAHDTGDATAQELDANPQYTDAAAYKVLDQSVFPFTLPFNQPVTAARAYLEHLGSSRYEVLDVFRKDDVDSTLRAVDAEYLKITPEEYQVLTGKGVGGADAPVREFYGYDTDDVTRTVDNAQTTKKWNDWLADATEFLQRTGIAYADLVELLKTRFINPGYPQGDALNFFESIPLSFADLAQLAQTDFASPDQKVLDALQQAGITLQELEDWSKTNFQAAAKLIVLDAPASACDLAVTRLRHLDTTLLDDSELGRLHRFIRLWRKLGWSLADLDRALTALQAADITADLLDELSRIKQLQDGISLSNLQVLLSLWAPIDARGADSLYRKLFLSKAAQKIDDVFDFQPDGSVLTAKGLKISDHIPSLLAALRVTEAELSAIRADAGLADDPTANPPTFAPLHLPNVSALYRYAALARALRLRVNDLIALKALSGIDPFAAPDQAIQFVTAASKVQQSGFEVAQLNYLFRHLTAPPASLAPQPAAVLLLAKALRDGLIKIAQDNAPAPDPSGETTRAKLALLFDGAVADQAIQMINGSAAYAAPLDTPPPNIIFPEAIKNKVSYDAGAKLLRFKGAMTTVEQTALLGASTDAEYQAAVNNLFQQPATYIQNTLSGFLDADDAEEKLLRDTPSLDSDLKPVLLDQNGNPTTDPAQAATTAVAEKFAYVLTRLLPYLRDQLSRAFVKQTVAGALDLNNALAQLLLENVLRSPADAAQPAIADLLALDTPGLTAGYFASNDLTGVATTVRTDGAVAFDGQAKTPETTIPAGTGSARWSGMLLAPNNGDFTFSVKTGGEAQLWVGDGAQPLTLQPDPSTGELVSQAVPLKAGRLYDLRLEVTQMPAQTAAAELRWQSATTPKAVVPSANLYPRALLDSLTSAFTLLQKSALVANTFKLTDEEVAHLSDPDHAPDFDGFDLNALPLARELVGGAQIDQKAPSLFKWWLRLSDLVALRDGLPRGEVSLIDVFAAPSLDGAKLELAGATGWDAPVIEALAGAEGFNLSAQDFKNEIALARLQRAVSLIKRLGVSAEQLFAWAEGDADFDGLETIAHDIKKTAHAKYDEETWLTVAKPLSDVLRESQRDALVAYLLPRIGEADAGRVSDANQLFEHFLIDVEMSACMETSRIKQAISSVQLFVQRVLMNLESVVDSMGAEIGVAPHQIDADHWNQWEWMKRYRVWEANRKVFLYPENWIEPELRDDKSPFFKELESELLQNNLTPDAVETAFMNYLEKLDQIARLEICGVYWQDKDPDTGEQVNILHVFGRTFNTPHLYYYRRLLNNSTWTAWEKVPLDIEGDHLIPVIWNRRLHLFWPIFAQKAEPPDTSQGIDISGQSIKPAEAKKYWQIKLAWSEYRQGKWQPKRMTNDFLASVHFDSMSVLSQNDTPGCTAQPETKRHIFQATVEGEELVVRVFIRDIDNIGVRDIGRDEDRRGPIFLGGTWLLGEFRFAGCRGIINVGYAINFTPRREDLPSHQMTEPIHLGSLGFPATEGDFEFQTWREKDDPFSNRLELWIRAEIKDKVFLGATPSVYHLLYPQQYSPYELQAPFFYQDDRCTYFVAPEVAVEFTIPLIQSDQFRLDPSLFVSVARAAPQVVLPNVVNKGGLTTFPQKTMMARAPGNWALGESTNRFAWAGSAAIAYEKYITRLQFFNYFHPYVCEFEKSLNRDGISGLLTVANQRSTDMRPVTTSLKPPIVLSTNNFEQQYRPNTLNVNRPYPNEDVDFSHGGSYSLYNWELFFHAPVFIATRLSKSQRFADAMKWFHYIFNPTDDTPGEASPGRYWKVLPFKSTEPERIDDMLMRLDAGDSDLIKQVDEWKNHPFQPHLLARLRLSAYQKNVFMKYADNLIAWGDQLFRQDTIESINEATQLYVLAADLLGQRPQQLPARGKVAPKTYAGLKGEIDTFANALVSLENDFPFSGGVSPDSGEADALLGVGRVLYFCAPQNDKLLGYWDTVADRLFKIRHCQNIEGVFRQLPLFEPPIDPALLVQAAAQGVDLSSVLNDLSAPLPHYRFGYVLQKALEMCAEVRSLGAALLAALEKRDAEELALLRATHETNILNLMEAVKTDQVNEAQSQLDALSQSQANAANDYIAYQTLLGVKSPSVPAWDQQLPILPIPTQPALDGEGGLPLLQYEQQELLSSHSARDWQKEAADQEITANNMAKFPDIEIAVKPFGEGISTTAGLRNVMAAYTATARQYQDNSAQSAYEASHAARLAGHFRQLQQWTEQSNHAAGEFMQIGKQIAAAKIRLDIAAKELAAHQQQMQDAQAVQDRLSAKFTSQDLYSWMIGDISATYFQCYQMAYDLAKKSERAFRFERGLTESNFIQFGYWDSLRKGLLAGERLHLALRQMERAYLEQNRREYEITKNVSLVLHDPLALITLKETGRCELLLPEALFDADYPGHYMRRIKSLSLTIPCVVGPYTGINCTLTLLANKTRVSTSAQAGYGEREDDDPRFVTNFAALQSIATSHAQNDSGMFELNFRDERYLPFEGAGVISRWRIEMPQDCNAFDFSTLTDVVLHLKYTAREGGEMLRGAAKKALQDEVADAGGSPLARLFSLKHEFPDEWYRFLHPTDPPPGDEITHDLQLDLTRERFPFQFRGKKITINELTLFLKIKDGFEYDGSQQGLVLQRDGAAAPPFMAAGSPVKDLPFTKLGEVPVELGNVFPLNLEVKESDLPQPDSASQTSWWQAVTVNNADHSRLKPEAIDDIWIICQYSVEAPK